MDVVRGFAFRGTTDAKQVQREFQQVQAQLDALTQEEAYTLIQSISEVEEAQTAAYIALLANTESIADFRQALPNPPVFDIAKETDAELLKFRDELRTVWEGTESEKIGVIVGAWIKRYPLDDARFWLVNHPSRSFIPLSKNTRAIAANIWYGKRHLLNRCSNPECRQFFIAKRVDQKYCLDDDCLKYGGRVRAYKHWKEKGRKQRSKKGGR
ncbi:MAG TPA: hypothetical protein VKB49_24060 [Candidatus Sulfotelmatobacter sp.]|nr:hypothetical protein [Candidatus Sulfotelmatobacter sp.]